MPDREGYCLIRCLTHYMPQKILIQENYWKKKKGYAQHIAGFNLPEHHYSSPCSQDSSRNSIES